MPLDEYSREFLRRQAAIYGDQGSLSWTERRALEVHELDFMLLGEPVEHVSDHQIEGPGGANRARFYKPEGTPDLPVMLFIHGGAWAMGSLEYSDPFCRAIANAAACAVLAIDYRLAPEHPHPAALEDCEAALRWLHSNGDALGVDRARVAVAGESAGGNLTAALAREAARTGDGLIALQCLLCPALDATMSAESVRNIDESLGITRAALETAWRTYRGEAAPGDPRISPLRDPADLALPPTLIVVGELDPLRDEGIQYAERLMRSGTEVCTRCYAEQLHSFFLYDRALPAASKARADIAAELRRAFARIEVAKPTQPDLATTATDP